jgi:hypothetical protein
MTPEKARADASESDMSRHIPNSKVVQHVLSDEAAPVLVVLRDLVDLLWRQRDFLEVEAEQAAVRLLRG